MKTQIDLKSAVCGLAAGVLLMLAVGASTSSNEVGRYQIAAAQGTIAIVDTKTGQAWGHEPTSSVQNRNDDNFWTAK